MTTKFLKIVLGLAFILVAFELRADPLNQWTWRFPRPQGYSLAAVTYGGGQFVAVGDNGTIITSPDAYNWTVQTFGVFPYLRGVAYADGEYAAVGDGGIILISSNAVFWTQVPSLTTSSLHGIAGDSTWRADDAPQFIAVGDSGTVLQCFSNTNWSVFSSGTTNALYSVSCVSPWYVAVGNAGTVIFYYNSEFYPVSGVGTLNNLYAVATASDGVAAAGGDLTANPFGYAQYYTNQILYSLDYGADEWYSQNWVIDPRDGIEPNLWDLSEFFILTGMTYGYNGFVGVGYTGYDLEYHPAVIMVSTNGTFWNELPSSTSENPLSGVTYGNGLYVAVGDFGSIVVSSNAINWSEIIPDRRSEILAIACNTNLCIATTLNTMYSWGFPDFSILVSTNGYITSTVAKKRGDLPTITDLACGGNQFVGVSGTSILTTTDGYNWTTNNAFTNSFNGVRHVNGQFFAVGNNGSIYSSIDGLNWSNCSVITSGSLNSVAYGNGLYVAAGSIAATSADGINWSVSPSNPPAVITKIVYGKGLFVGATYSGSGGFSSGSIVTSKNGVNWQVPLTSYAFSGIAYSGGIFLASSGPFGVTFGSIDGTNWQQTSSSLPLGLFEYYSNPFPGSYSTVCAYQGTFLVGGMDGMLIQSGLTWNSPLISALQTTSGGFIFSYNQQIDVPYRIQTSTNLLHWADVYSGTGTGQSTNFTYSASGISRAQFFRIISP